MTFLDFFSGLPPWLGTMLVAGLPISELQLAIPFGISHYGLSAWQAYALSVAGNLLIVLSGLRFMGPLSQWLSQKSFWWRRFFDWVFRRTRSRFTQKYIKYGEWAILFLVAVPLPFLPFSGSWSGAAAIFLFDISYTRGALLITGGASLAGLIILSSYVGLLKIFT